MSHEDSVQKGSGSMSPGKNNIHSPTTQEEKITLLCISPSREDYSSLRDIFVNPSWRIRRAQDFKEAAQILSNGEAAVVLCERELPDSSWRDVLRTLTASENQPPLVVLSRAADQDLWAEVLNLGGYDVLLKPFEKSEVLRVVSMAWRQYQSRSKVSARTAMVH